MPRDHRISQEPFPLTKAQRLREQAKSYQHVAATGGWSFAQVRRKLLAVPIHGDAPAHPSAPEPMDPPTWVNRGTHLAADMVEAIKVYAQEHRMKIREVIDLGLRAFFTQGSGEVVRDD